jgi:peptidoglycan hydrolase FlgJ
MSKLTALPPVALPPSVHPGTSRPAQSADPSKAAKSANEFEAMAIGELLKPMFDTVDTTRGKFGGGHGEEAWKPMLVQEFAKQISNHGGLGLAKPIYESIMRMQGHKVNGR